MPIPFVRQLPTGRRVMSEVSLFPAIEDQAREFIAMGGRYLIEILPSTKVRVVACWLNDGKQVDIEERVVPNGPELTAAINDLISDSIRHVRETKH